MCGPRGDQRVALLDRLPDHGQPGCGGDRGHARQAPPHPAGARAGMDRRTSPPTSREPDRARSPRHASRRRAPRRLCRPGGARQPGASPPCTTRRHARLGPAERRQCDRLVGRRPGDPLRSRRRHGAAARERGRGHRDHRVRCAAGGAGLPRRPLHAHGGPVRRRRRRSTSATPSARSSSSASE